MLFLETLKEKTKNMWTIFSRWPIKIKIDCPHSFTKTIKKIHGIVLITASADLKIKKIHYQIIEIVDPIIWKNKEEAELLWSSDLKKGFSLSSWDEKELPFTITIQFESEKKHHHGGDMSLLNHMSERSKKTAVNYTLHIKISYTSDESSDLQTKEIKHDVNFE